MASTQHYPTQAVIAKAYGVTSATVCAWAKSDDFPKKLRHGYPIAEVAQWVQARMEKREATLGAAGDREEKTRLECERLRVVIEREREILAQACIETKRLNHELHAVADCESEWVRAGALLRGTVESWRNHETAKAPRQKKYIDGLASRILAAIRNTKATDES